MTVKTSLDAAPASSQPFSPTSSIAASTTQGAIEAVHQIANNIASAQFVVAAASSWDKRKLVVSP